MKFENLIGKYEGATIGVLGAGPSLNEFKDRINVDCDVVISCNGAISVLNPEEHKVDSILYADEFEPSRNWFSQDYRFKSSNGGSILRIGPHFLMPFDRHVIFNEQLRNRLHNRLEEQIIEDIGCNEEAFLYFQEYWSFLKSTKEYDSSVRLQEENLRIRFNKNSAFLKSILYNQRIGDNFSNGVPIILKGFYEEFENETPIADIIANFNPDKSEFFMNGTISCIGSQIAHSLGARKIVLFGCDFNNVDGTNYAYENKEGYYGVTSLRCREVFDEYIAFLQKGGVDVVHYGKTNLTNPKIEGI